MKADVYRSVKHILSPFYFNPDTSRPRYAVFVWLWSQSSVCFTYISACERKGSACNKTITMPDWRPKTALLSRNHSCLFCCIVRWPTQLANVTVPKEGETIHRLGSCLLFPLFECEYNPMVPTHRQKMGSEEEFSLDGFIVGRSIY